MQVVSRRIALDAGQSVSAIIALPDAPAATLRTAVVLAHGAGNDMHSPFLTAVHEGLAARGYVAVKFNFPYKESGRRAPDRAPVLERCFERVVDAVRGDRRIGAQRLVIGGKSLGGRMATHLAAAGAAVAGVLLLGYPLHPAGQPDKVRVAHLAKIRVPMLFISGTRDPLCSLDLLRPALDQLTAPVTLHLIEGGDHSFKVPRALRRPPEAVWNEIVDVSTRWLGNLA